MAQLNFKLSFNRQADLEMTQTDDQSFNVYYSHVTITTDRLEFRVKWVKNTHDVHFNIHFVLRWYRLRGVTQGKFQPTSNFQSTICKSNQQLKPYDYHRFHFQLINMRFSEIFYFSSQIKISTKQFPMHRFKCQKISFIHRQPTMLEELNHFLFFPMQN